MYKDFVRILQTDYYMEDHHLMDKVLFILVFCLIFERLFRITFKGEFHFEKDKLLSGGQMGEMTNSINYREVFFLIFCINFPSTNTFYFIFVLDSRI